MEQIYDLIKIFFPNKTEKHKLSLLSIFLNINKSPSIQ
jgi:hypothetical protein